MQNQTTDGHKHQPIGTAGLALIMSFEGCRLKAYKAVPTEKYWTIGWGHYGPDVSKDQTITQAQADAFLLNDCQKFADAVDDPGCYAFTDPLNANERDALISFAYNCGIGNLHKLCHGRTKQQIGAAIILYNKSGGKVLKGLTTRRSAEQKLFNSPV